MSWVIRGYDREGETLHREILVDDCLRSIFRAILGTPPSDPMFDSYPIDSAARDSLEGLLQIELDSSSDEYFLDYDAPPSSEGQTQAPQGP